MEARIEVFQRNLAIDPLKQLLTFTVSKKLPAFECVSLQVEYFYTFNIIIQDKCIVLYLYIYHIYRSACLYHYTEAWNFDTTNKPTMPRYHVFLGYFFCVVEVGMKSAKHTNSCYIEIRSAITHM